MFTVVKKLMYIEFLEFTSNFKEALKLLVNSVIIVTSKRLQHHPHQFSPISDDGKCSRNT